LLAGKYCEDVVGVAPLDTRVRMALRVDQSFEGIGAFFVPLDKAGRPLLACAHPKGAAGSLISADLWRFKLGPMSNQLQF
jgi:hypothetical protein